MGKPLLSDTIAARMIDELISHSHNSEVVLDDNDYLFLIQEFKLCGGSWEALLSGSPDGFVLIKKIIDSFLNP